LNAGPTVADHEAFWAEWALRIQTLERGIEQAREQGISVSKAKRVLKELQAQANAAEAASKLEALLLRKPCKASVLKVIVLRSCCCNHSSCGTFMMLLHRHLPGLVAPDSPPGLVAADSPGLVAPDSSWLKCS